MTGAQHKILPTPMATASFCATARLAPPPVLSTNKNYYKNSSTWLLLRCTSASQLVASGQIDIPKAYRKLITQTTYWHTTATTYGANTVSASRFGRKNTHCVHRFLGFRAKHAHVFQKTRESTPRHASVRAGCDRLGGA